MSTQTITEFLEARIAEDEVSATLRECHREDCGWIPDESGYSYPCNCGLPERMAAECAAKRAIVEMVQPYLVYRSSNNRNFELLQVLAAVYADHADYRQEWAL